MEKMIDEKPFSFVFLMVALILLIDMAVFGYAELREMVLCGILAFFISFILSAVLKMLFRVCRDGPCEYVQDYRFPSSHTAIGTALSIVPVLVNPYFIPLLILVPITAHNRISLGRHTWYEVGSGLLTGVISVVIVCVLLGFS